MTLLGEPNGLICTVLPLKASNGDSPEFADPGNTAEAPALGSFPLDLNLCLDFD